MTRTQYRLTAAALAVAAIALVAFAGHVLLRPVTDEFGYDCGGAIGSTSVPAIAIQRADGTYGGLCEGGVYDANAVLGLGLLVTGAVVGIGAGVLVARMRSSELGLNRS
jgi:hypothetical protein